MSYPPSRNPRAAPDGGAGYGSGYSSGPGPSTSYGAAWPPPARPPYGAAPATAQPLRPAAGRPAAALAAAAGGAGGGAVGGCGVDPWTLRFREAALEAAYLSHQAARLAGVDRAAFLATAVLILMSWLTRGEREQCHGVQVLTTLAFLGHALALLVMHSPPAPAPASPSPSPSGSGSLDNLVPPPSPLPPPPPLRRVAYLAAVRLAYAAAYAAAHPACRRDDLLSCSSGAVPAFALPLPLPLPLPFPGSGSGPGSGPALDPRSGSVAPGPSAGRVFVTDTALVLLLFQTIALPLPYRVHMGVSGGVLALLAALHNDDVCGALCASCHAAWFSSALHRHHRLARALLLAARALGGRPFTFGPTHACWCSLLFAQVVAGFLLPGCVTYLVEEAARRRYLAGWSRRRQQQQMQAQLLQAQAQVGAAAAAAAR